jgi:hypothetical protein
MAPKKNKQAKSKRPTSTQREKKPVRDTKARKAETQQAADEAAADSQSSVSDASDEDAEGTTVVASKTASSSGIRTEKWGVRQIQYTYLHTMITVWSVATIPPFPVMYLARQGNSIKFKFDQIRPQRGIDLWLKGSLYCYCIYE